MDGVHAFFLRERHDALDVEIGAERSFGLVQFVGFIRLEAVRAEPVLAGVDGHRADAQFRRRAHDADGDLGAVRHHQLADGADASGGRVQ